MQHCASEQIVLTLVLSTLVRSYAQPIGQLLTVIFLPNALHRKLDTATCFTQCRDNISNTTRCQYCTVSSK
jgi:hypothetical protein